MEEKQTQVNFKRQTSEISCEKTGRWIKKKGKFKRESKSLLIAAHNNIIWTKYHYHLVVLSARISLTLSRHHSLSFIASDSPQGYMPCPHRPAIRRFEQVTLIILGHVKGSIGVDHLWARPYFSSSVLHVRFV